jgi:RHS repeat-associated protein
VDAVEETAAVTTVPRVYLLGERVHKALTMGETETYTYYFGALYEEDQPSGTQRYYYTFAGQTIAQRENTAGGEGATTLKYLHGDHLGSASLLTNASGPVQSLGSQEYDPWGKTLAALGGGAQVTQTRLNYTGQKKDDTGLLYYHARMYDPALGRFVSPDSIVPGASSSVGGIGASK